MIREVQPEVKSGLTWTAEQAMTEGEACLRTKNIVGAVNSHKAGPSNKVHRWVSAHEPKDRREVVIEQVRVIDEQRRSAIAAGFAKQCAWSKLERGRREKTKLAKRCSHGAIAIASSSDRPITSSQLRPVLQRFAR